MRASVGDVSATNPVRVLLEIECEQATVSGRLAVEGAHESEFFGWLELIDQLQRAIDRDAPGELSIGGDQ